jgi:microcystin-dependent protein
MALHTCECVAGQTIEGKLTSIYCALLQLVSNNSAEAAAFAAYQASRIGIVEDYAGATAPSGSLLCFGQEVSRITYASLFNVIGSAFGNGTGTTTFNLPDCRGRVSAGQDDMGGVSANRLTNPASTPGGINGDTLGATGGVETHTLTEAQLAAHVHSTTYTDGGGSGDTGGATPQLGIAQGSLESNPTGGDSPHNNVQPTIIFNKIIYTGVA